MAKYFMDLHIQLHQFIEGFEAIGLEPDELNRHEASFLAGYMAGLSGVGNPVEATSGDEWARDFAVHFEESKAFAIDHLSHPDR